MTSPKDSEPAEFAPRFKPWKSKFLLLVVPVILILGIRLYFSVWVLHYVNQKINENGVYSGSIENVDLHLWRGAYVIRNITIYKNSGKVPVPFFSAPAIDFSCEWKALFNGAFVGNVECEKPKLNFVNGPTEAASQAGGDTPWIAIIKKLFPLHINRFHVDNGEVHYRDFYSHPQVDIALTEVYLTASNLNNSRKLAKSAVATIHAEGKPVKEGMLKIDVTLDPYPVEPTFTLKGEMTPIPMSDLNQLARAYGNFDFQSGTFAAAMQIKAEKGRFQGYFKPVLDHMEIANSAHTSNNSVRFVWDVLLDTTGHLLRNLRKDRFATLIPISGSIHHPQTAVMAAIGNVFKNAFVRPYSATVPGSIDTSDTHTKESPTH